MTQYVVEFRDPDDTRPVLSSALTGAELRRWYWLKVELAGFARTLKISGGGSKRLLTDRIVSRLDGTPLVDLEGEPGPARPRAPSTQLAGALSAPTVIPRGQRCSQVVRAWFTDQVGTKFRFDACMRDFFAHTDGTQTMQEALDHWKATRAQRDNPIDVQFEYNQFTRDWYASHPDGAREACLAAWWRYRSRPTSA